MAEAGDQRQRHGMGEVRADDAHRRQDRVEEQQRRDAERTGADRGERDQHAEQRADGDGGRADAARVPGVGEVGEGEALHARLEDEGGGGEQQRHAERAGNQVREEGAIDIEIPDRGERQCRRRQTARGQPPGDAPVHRAVMGMDGRAACLGQGGVEEIGADRRGRVHAEQQHQQRRHERTAADAGQADDGADDESGECIGRIHSRYGW